MRIFAYGIINNTFMSTKFFNKRHGYIAVCDRVLDTGFITFPPRSHVRWRLINCDTDSPCEEIEFVNHRALRDYVKHYNLYPVHYV